MGRKRRGKASSIPSSRKSCDDASRKLVTQAQTIAPRELMQSGGRGRTSPPLCKFFESLRIAFFLFQNIHNTCGKSLAWRQLFNFPEWREIFKNVFNKNVSWFWIFASCEWSNCLILASNNQCKLRKLQKISSKQEIIAFPWMLHCEEARLSEQTAFNSFQNCSKLILFHFKMLQTMTKTHLPADSSSTFASGFLRKRWAFFLKAVPDQNLSILAPVSLVSVAVPWRFVAFTSSPDTCTSMH